MLGKIKCFVAFFLYCVYVQADTLATFQVIMPKFPSVYYDVHYEFNESLLNKQYQKWKKYDTGRYVYILDGNATNYPLSRLKRKLVFVADHSLEWSVDLGDIEEGKEHIQKHSYHIKQIKSKKLLCGMFLQSQKFSNQLFSLDYMFPTVRQLSRRHTCKKIKFEYEFDPLYGYITFEEKKCMGIPNYHTTVNYVYGLLLLPENEAYTDKVMHKILDKYKKAFECAKRIEWRKVKTDTNLTRLEQAVGKERLECLDRYLVWDENASK